MILRLLKKLLDPEVLSFILALLSLQMLAYGISSSLRGTETRYLFTICIIAAALGWTFSKSKLTGSYASLLIALLGIVGLWIVAARLLLPVLELIKSLGSLLPQIFPAIHDKTPFDASLVQAASTVVSQYSSALLLRWQGWLIGVVKHVTVDDALIRNMIWSFMMWCLAAWTGWHMARRNAVLALLPNIALMALVLSYSEYRIYSLWLMVIIMLLLMGIWNYKNHTMQWEHRKVDYSDSILYDNTQAVIFMALLIGTIAFSTPSISWKAIRDAFRNRDRNETAEVLGIQQQRIPVKNVPFQQPSLPREHLLTEGFEQSKELVMTIRTGELPPITNPSITEGVPQHYWRSTIYDVYMGTGWVTSGTTPQSYKANTPLIPGLLDDYQPLHLDVKLFQPEGKLFWSGILYSASVPFRADWRIRPQSNLFADQTALLQPDMFLAASGTSSYQVDSYVSQVTVEKLRAASADYPEGIRAHYLSLPAELPPRVHQLVETITRGINNPYDKAKAIERYLRTHYPYDLKVPVPPKDQDVADYFLFDLKKGYCDYYATAMVVLARSSGLPSRFVSGYSSGSYDAPNAQYVVREINAHSWAEIYFPGIGWIEFEPTASQPEIVRLQKEAELPVSVPPPTPAKKFLFKLTNTGVLYWLSSFAVALLLVILYFATFERILILRRAPASAIAFLYRRYYRIGRPLAGTRTRAETATEFTYKLIHKIDESYRDSKRLQPPAFFNRDARKLTSLYLLSVFSNHTINKGDAKEAFTLWKRLRRQILLTRFRDFTVRGVKKRSH